MKKRFVVLLAMLILLSAAAYADCQNPMNGKAYTTDRRFCGDTFFLPDGIIIAKDNVLIDCNHAIIKGIGFENTGIMILNRKNITIRNCKIANYATGLYASNSTGIIFYGNTLMRNKVGLKLLSVANSTFDENFDISLEVPAKLTESSSNIMRLVNKKLEDDFCRTNKCNTKSYLTVQDNTEEKATLLKTLKTAIQEWILS